MKLILWSWWVTRKDRPPFHRQHSLSVHRGGTGASTGNYLFSPDSLSPGAFAYKVSGSGQDMNLDSGSNLRYQSTSLETVIGLVSPDDRYSLSLFLPFNLQQGTLKLKEYNSASPTQAPGAAIYISIWLYVADGGEIAITKDPSGGKLSGMFRFNGHNKDDPSKTIEVVGALNEVPLKK